MSLFHRTHTLLQVSTAANTNQTGKSYAVVPNADDLSFRAFVDIEQSGGSGSPSTTLHLETSYDGHWIEAMEPIQLAGEGSTHKFVEVEALGPLVRARTVVAGSSKPSHTVTVKLAANGAFQVREKAATYNTSSSDPMSPSSVSSPA